MSNIRRMVKSDYLMLRDHFKVIYKNNQLLLKQEYFDWEYLDSTGIDAQYNFWISFEDNGDISGFIGAAKFLFSHNNKNNIGCWVQLWYSKNRDSTGLALLYTLKKSFDNTFFVGFTDDAAKVYKALGYEINLFFRYLFVVDEENVVDALKVKFTSDDIKELVRNKKRLMDKLNSIDDGNKFSIIDMSKADTFLKKVNFVEEHSSIANYRAYLSKRYVDIPFHCYKLLYISDTEYMIFRYDDIYNSKFTILKILEWSKYNSTNLMKRLLDDAKDKNVLLVEFYSSNFLCSSNLEEIGFTIDNKIINKIPNLFNPVNFGSTIRFAYELSDNLDEKLSFDFTKGASDLDRDKKGLYEI